MNTDRPTASILIVDDEQSGRLVLCRLLNRAGYETVDAASISEGISKLQGQSFDLVVSDLRVDSESGLDIIKLVQRSYPGTESILITGYGSIENAVEAIQSGACEYITKPFDNQQFIHRVKKTLEQQKMKAELTALRQHVAMSYGFDNIIGISKELMQLKETARRIAPTDITILISGPSGTGKELFARAIHHHSQRRNAPFIAIDCSAIPEALLESELFGHTKGSFTSAVRTRVGLLEEADGGTIFLDELSNMPANIQMKLLRFLQEFTIRPVGSSEIKKVDVRIIGATNQELSKLVEAGTFREDLYYRLNVIPLELPPLIKRPEDIEMLAEYFLRVIAAKMEKPPFILNRQAVEKLQMHRWPGNIRELENTLKRSAALCRSNKIEASDIVFVGGESLNGTDNTDTAIEGTRRLTLTRGLLDDSQRSTILHALNENDWNYTKTAVSLGIGRTTLWRKIKRYHLLRVMQEL